MSTGTRYTSTIKMAFLEDYAKLPMGEGGRRKGVCRLRDTYGISHATADRWVKSQGAASRPGRKMKVETSGATTSNSVYFLGELKFTSKEKAIRYAVEAMGGLTVHTVSTTKTIRKVEL